jgi:hypothetical protein
MAESLGIIELKQSRVNRVIRFTTDYTHLGVKAGDLIDVTNSVLNYTNKMFRIVSMAEADAEDGGLNITITALEYDEDVYNLDDIFRYERSNQNGLVTIGYVGAPTTPTITAYANSSRPRTTIATTVPTGIVDGIEFWFSSDGTNYALLATQTPTGGAFTYGQSVIYDYDKYTVTSNVYAKCRAVNSTTTSDYSSVGSLLNFAPVQTTDAIKDGTTSLLSSGGSGLATALGIATLVQKLGNAFGSNGSSTLSQAVFSQGGVADQMSCVNENGQGFCDFINTGPRYLSGANNVAITTAFDSGEDLDIRFRIIAPSAGQNVVGDYIGWSCQSQWPTSGTPILTWGGDNTGTGAESVRLNLDRWKVLYPGNNEIAIECRAFWYVTAGATVYTTGSIFKGGTMTVVDYEWVNPTATSSALLDSAPALITTQTTSPTTLGDFIAYFVYNISTGRGVFTK